jgi:transcriptional antiterminator RfaH
MRWFVVHTQPRSEERARFHLEAQSFRCFLPRLRKIRRHARREDVVIEPLFPRYLFTFFDPSAVRWRAINGSRGVVHLLTHDNDPIPVPRGVVEDLIAAADEQGAATFSSLLALKKGSKVRITGGPFKGQTAEVDETPLSGADRVRLLLEILGKSAHLRLPAYAFEPV